MTTTTTVPVQKQPRPSWFLPVMIVLGVIAFLFVSFIGLGVYLTATGQVEATPTPQVTVTEPAEPAPTVTETPTPSPTVTETEPVHLLRHATPGYQMLDTAWHQQTSQTQQIICTDPAAQAATFVNKMNRSNSPLFGLTVPQVAEFFTEHCTS